MTLKSTARAAMTRTSRTPSPPKRACPATAPRASRCAAATKTSRGFGPNSCASSLCASSPRFRRSTASVRRQPSRAGRAVTPTLRALITPGRPDAQARACPAEYMDRFSTTFIERRQQALQRFLDRIALHSLLRKSDNLRLFLEAKAWVRGSGPWRPPPSSGAGRARARTS